jgi:curli production protein
MVADMQMQVWLDTVAGTAPAVVVPYVQTDQDARLGYRMSVVKTGRSGSSRIDQSGTVLASAGKPKEMSRLSVWTQEGDTCQIEIEMLEEGKPRGRYRFDCPR